MLLARYDRAVAGALFQPLDDYLHSLPVVNGPTNDFNPGMILGKACIDPRGAVALLESMTPPAFSRTNPVHSARRRLAEMLGLPADERWKRLWQTLGIQAPLEE